MKPGPVISKINFKKKSISNNNSKNNEINMSTLHDSNKKTEKQPWINYFTNKRPSPTKNKKVNRSNSKSINNKSSSNIQKNNMVKSVTNGKLKNKRAY